MNTKELSRLEVVQKLSEKRISQKEAGRVLGVNVRHVKRKLSSYRRDRAQGLISKRSGQPGNNRLLETTRRGALDLLKSNYQGFGPIVGV